MSRGAPPQRVPSAITEGNFIDVTAPTASEDGKALVLNWSTGIFDWVDLATAAELATHAALTATHGVSGAIVGTTDTQTLTNKTLTTPTIADFTNATHDHSNDAGGGTISGGGGGTPGGSSGQWQYNNAGAFAGDSGVTRPTAGTLQLSTALVTPVIAPASDSTAALKLTRADKTTAVIEVDTTNSRWKYLNGSDYVQIHADGGNPTIRIFNAGELDASITANSSQGFYFNSKITVNGTISTAGAFSATQLTSQDASSPRVRVWKSGVHAFDLDGASTQVLRLLGTNGIQIVRFDDTTGGASYFGRVSFGTHAPTSFMDIQAATTSAASLRIRSGVAPTSPNDGDIWFDGTNFKCRIGGVTKTITVT